VTGSTTTATLAAVPARREERGPDEDQTFAALVAEPLRIDREGYVHVPDRPGLGVDLNEETIARYGRRG